MTRVSASPVRVDEQAFGDPRIAMVGELAGYNAFEALGRMTHLWRWCTQRQTHVVTEATVRVMLGANGVDALIGSELGERVPEGIRIRGTGGRIEWPTELAEKRRVAGEASATRQRDKRGRLLPSPALVGDAGQVVVEDTIDTGDFGADESSKTPAPVQHPSSKHQHPSSKPPAQSTTRSGSRSGSEEEERADRSAPAGMFALEPEEPKPAKPVVPGLAETRDAFDAAYREQNAGAKPTWGARQIAQLKKLISAHTAAEVQRRIAVLFSPGAPGFIRPPFDIGTLEFHFDKLAQPSASARASPAPDRNTEIRVLKRL